jgi:hypothetical protein
MQLGIPVAYNIREGKPDNINHWIRVHREEFVSYDSTCTLNYNLKVGLVYWVCKNH